MRRITEIVLVCFLTTSIMAGLSVITELRNIKVSLLQINLSMVNQQRINLLIQTKDYEGMKKLKKELEEDYGRL